ncbi:MAG: hypothetical protein RLZZ143_1281 [Cyanobacteriota bacterium]|jgi:NAD(P)-dependent dehydrogenase (short-subunit alcohol dehydrogenase family)
MRIYFMTNLTNHKALITGASRGIGVAIASFLDNQGTEIIAPMQLIKGFSPAMKTAGWGRIFNISSIFSLFCHQSRTERPNPQCCSRIRHLWYSS